MKQLNKKLEQTGIEGVADLENSVTARSVDYNTSTTLLESTIPWQSYPYSSRDTFTLKSRANKVKERVLACTTQNKLITLYAEGKVSKAEINWLKSNLLTTVERQQLEAVETTKQTNLFDGNDEKLTVKKVIEQIDTEAKRIGWSKKTAINYIEDKYSVSSRQDMTIQQLIELRDYLRRFTTEKMEDKFNETD